MLRFVACSLLVAFASPEEPPDRTSESAEALATIGSWPDEGFFQLGRGQLDRLRLREEAGGPSLVLEKLDDGARGQLGVPEGRGLVATAVRVDGPAWEAGVREQDVLLTLNDEPLAEPEDLARLLKKAGDEPATLTVLRERKPTTLKVQARVRVDLGPLEDEAPEFWIGATVEPVAPILREQLDIPAGQGLTVSRLVDDAPAVRGGLQVHDVILTLDGEAVPDAAGLVARVGKAGTKPLTFEILRAGEKRPVAVTPEKRPPRDVLRRYYVADRPARSARHLDVVRPGVLLGADQLGRLLDLDTPDASVRRLDDMAGEIKALRRAIESLRKAVEAAK